MIRRSGTMREVLAAAQSTEMTSPSTMAPHDNSIVTAAPSRRRPKLANTGANLKLYTRLRGLVAQSERNGLLPTRVHDDLTYFDPTVNGTRDAEHRRPGCRPHQMCATVG